SGECSHARYGDRASEVEKVVVGRKKITSEDIADGGCIGGTCQSNDSRRQIGKELGVGRGKTLRRGCDVLVVDGKKFNRPEAHARVLDGAKVEAPRIAGGVGADVGDVDSGTWGREAGGSSHWPADQVGSRFGSAGDHLNRSDAGDAADATQC